MHFITVSDQLGTKGEKIGRRVAESLGYSFIGKEEIERIGAEMGFQSDLRKIDDEKKPPFLDQFFTDRPKIYLDRMQSAIYEIARRGDAVFLGRGSTFLLHSFECALHVLIIGSMGKRVQTLMEEKHVTKEVAERMIHRSDQDKRGFMRFAFNEDWLNPNLYDLIINTDKLSVDAATELILRSAKSEEIRECGVDAVKTLARLSLIRKIEAAVLETSVDASHVFISVEDTDVVRLYGFVFSREEKEELERVARRFKEVRSVKNDLTISPPQQ
jgi:cytidylate kinase